MQQSSLNETISPARFEAMERSIITMSDQVGRVASYMERLVLVEERNSTLAVSFREQREETNRQLETMSALFTKSVDKLVNKQEEADDKHEVLSTNVTRIMAVLGVVSTIITIIVPIVIANLISRM
ncbi:hypothetical protein [Mesorhizobium sp. STM 4661]|uniref:hypothetical protein n=1 Tax=Mesorhizobium sp. STM 4661 TaxID=1297570 RepID=UPI0002BF83F2|nr:hypothetical protein [Mesorhizobium sp. STM 4661]CCV12917.1 hypothetical protein MESS4_510084 [Mesorhizobium sp. STM 4661]